jgi:hypothetical protein
MGEGLMRAMLYAQLGRATSRQQGTRLTPEQTAFLYALLMKTSRAASSEPKA